MGVHTQFTLNNSYDSDDKYKHKKESAYGMIVNDKALP
jgi:hypothetical protein